MTKKYNKQLRLAAFGFDARSQESFRMTFKGPGKGKAALVDEQNADFGIINLDAADSDQLLQEYQRRYPGRPAIKLSVKDLDANDALSLKKPASIDDMLAAVDSLVEQLEKNLSSQTTPAEKSEPKPAIAQSTPELSQRPSTTKNKKLNKSSIYYNPKDYLQGEIHSALEYSKKSSLVTELWVMSDQNEWKKIVFIPGIKKVLTSISDKDLRAYCSMPASLMTIKMYRRNERESALIQARVERDGKGISFDGYLWRVALYTSQGRLPQGTSLEAAARLKQWPNLTRLYPVAGSMRIATLLVDQPRTLPLIAKVLKMPAGRVFAFYSAACAIGIADNVKDIGLAQQSIPQRHKNHGLLGRILNRLKKNSDPETEIYA